MTVSISVLVNARSVPTTSIVVTEPTKPPFAPGELRETLVVSQVGSPPDTLVAPATDAELLTIDSSTSLLHFNAGFHLFLGEFFVIAGIVNGFLSVADNPTLAENLRVISHPCRRGKRAEGVFVAFKLSVGSRRAQRVDLPFWVRRLQGTPPIIE